MNNSLDKTNLILDLIAKKQETIGANLANVNTPGYVRQDINFQQYIGALDSPLETKLSKKLGPSPLMKQSGGEVSTPAELIELQKNALLYSVATRRVSAIIQELKTVTQVGK
ncbi:MAG: hypothetical protein A2287_05525 [Candidatus Melainabacteria bacterium RIFOXYA12_FULL_32_12]|nr:MAG: hypothetical protein A2104_04400 [Candidatus Melainabacteria bacterium GWF2_32_7]OGI18455.1 MAG: hypothetical protein A2255_04150 [Candidatus Melainabacteria bacterium RIFOXYA2_FULL_32_9]OGI30985.1 MAG: hypothetical protein A2287_05525 [Candidatus Melainabacteria bacterium RIFOXYA12_FULL_32_12]